ncbi:MAG: hypothetical protein ACXIUM_03615 [Wenzhouxiangella sp.]
MNPSPDTRLAELSAEQSLNAEHPPKHPALQADWQLKQELRQLPPAVLPPALRARIIAQTADKARRRLPPRWLGLAAALTLALGLVWLLPLDQAGPEQGRIQADISTSDLEQLQLALAALDDSARLTGRIAGRELSAPFATPVIQLDELPLAPGLLRWMQPPRNNTADS